jgi:hypothetical protein
MSTEYLAELLREESAFYRTEAEKYAGSDNIGTVVKIDAHHGQADPLAYSQNCLMFADFCDRLVSKLEP